MSIKKITRAAAVTSAILLSTLVASCEDVGSIGSNSGQPGSKPTTSVTFSQDRGPTQPGKSWLRTSIDTGS